MIETGSLPEGLLIAFYGDDFTGSSAVMEILSFAGLPTVLFLDPPTAEDLEQFASYRAIGVAGVARAQSPEWMDHELPPIFSALEALGAPITHFKTCSTLDSSPTVGSIGRAIDLAIPIISGRPGAASWQPLIVAAPGIGRYQAFGNLFAAYDGRHFRLDRHPVMRRHPATPMDEGDVALHLERQTERKIGLVDVTAVKSGAGGAELDRQLNSGHTVVSIDVLDDETLLWAGREIWLRRAGGVFAIGSQGVEYALTAYWRHAGMLREVLELPAAAAVDRVIVASGSVSPITATQIAWAAENGFEVVPVDPEMALTEDTWRVELGAAIASAKAALSQGRSPILATALGPDDPSIARLKRAVAAAGASPGEVNSRVGTGLGEALRHLLEATGLRRAVVAGGDTSGYAARALGIRALTALAPMAAGCPLCLAFADGAPGEGLEIALKGGQMGAADFFGTVRAGRAIAAKEN